MRCNVPYLAANVDIDEIKRSLPSPADAGKIILKTRKSLCDIFDVWPKR